jgi:hypothetical protein
MADEQQSKPSFKHAVVKKALAPLVATAATAVTTYLMRKATEVWHETVQPKVEEKGGAEALARQAAGAVSSKLAPVSEAVTPKAGGDEPDEAREDAPEPDADRSEERRKREQRRNQRAKALDQARTT